METLPYHETQPLSIPADVFSIDGIAFLIITGGSYGGEWVLKARASCMPVDTSIGSITTSEAPRQPERALTSIRAWLEAYCAGTPFALVHFESLNGIYAPADAPFFCSAQAAIAIPMT